MLYYDANNEFITEGFATLKTEAESPDATPAAIAYHELLHAISRGEGFNYMTGTTRVFDLNKSDLRDLLKELLYAIETERITDRHTHRDIVEEALESVLVMFTLNN